MRFFGHCGDVLRLEQLLYQVVVQPVRTLSIGDPCLLSLWGKRSHCVAVSVVMWV